jgi:hypothetical protein
MLNHGDERDMFKPAETIRGDTMLTWVARIRLPGGQQMQVQVRAPTQPAARQLIVMQYSNADLISGPNRLDLTRAIYIT